MGKTHNQRKAQFLQQLLQFLFEELPSTEMEESIELYADHSGILFYLNGQIFFCSN